MRIFFFNRFFHPDSSATSQILSDLAFHLARRHEVHVVTCVVPGGERAEEEIQGVHVHRVAGVPAGAHGLARRALAYAGYYSGARRAVRRLVREGDLVVAKTDPPMLSTAIGSLARARGAKVVVWLQDLFPEVAREYGVAGFRGPLGAWLADRRDRSLAHSDAVVAIGRRMARRVEGAVPAGRLHVIENWADGGQLRPAPGSDAERRRELGLERRFVVAYSGNLGRVHEFDTLLSAAAILREQAEIAFLVVGRGPRLAETRERARREGLANVVFADHQPRGSLLQSLNLADVHLVVLRPEFEGLVLPSKLYGAMAVGKPTIFVGDPDGEVAQILGESGAGLAVRTGEARALAQAVHRLQSDAALRQRMGEAARAAFLARNDMAGALGRWETLLASLAMRT